MGKISFDIPQIELHITAAETLRDVYHDEAGHASHRSEICTEPLCDMAGNLIEYLREQR